MTLLVAQLVKNPPTMQGPQFNFWGERTLLLCLIFALGFRGGSDGKELTCNAGDLDLIPVLGRSSGEGNGYLL